MKNKIVMALTALLLTLGSATGVNALTEVSFTEGNVAHNDANANGILDDGEEVCIDKECFYVVDYDEYDEEVMLLAKYNLYVGFNKEDTDSGDKETKIEETDEKYGLQNELAKGENFSDKIRYGLVDFEESSEYIKKYVDYLNNEYDVSATGTMLDEELLQKYGCDVQYDEDNNEKPEWNCDAPDWFVSTSYWVDDGNAYPYYVEPDNSGRIAISPADGGIALIEPMDIEIHGARPVITISTTLFNEYKVTVSEVENGNVELSKGEDEVVVKVVADEGYELDSIKALDASNKEVDLVKNEDGTYTINKIDSDIKITVTLKKLESTTPDDKKDTEQDQTKDNEIENPNTSDNIVGLLTLSLVSLAILSSSVILLKKQHN